MVKVCRIIHFPLWSTVRILGKHYFMLVHSVLVVVTNSPNVLPPNSLFVASSVALVALILLKQLKVMKKRDFVRPGASVIRALHTYTYTYIYKRGRGREASIRNMLLHLILGFLFLNLVYRRTLLNLITLCPTR